MTNQEQMNPKKVLIVDDESTVRNLISITLRRQGIPTLQAADGAQAVEQYANHLGQIGLVLMDVQMPRMDGPTTLEALREISPDVVCCLMTGYADKYGSGELSHLGVEAVFLKPFNIHDFLPIVKRLLSSVRTSTAEVSVG